MKKMLIAAVAVMLITPTFADEAMNLTDFTREDEVYIQRGYTELQGSCAIMAIHEVLDYGMEDEYALVFISEEVAVLRKSDSVGTICTPTEMISVYYGETGLTHSSMKHEEMCYFDESC